MNPDKLHFLVYYFPQWYPVLENKNKTDWPLLSLEKNLNGVPIDRPKNKYYYDSRSLDVRTTQGELAKKYGIDGFIYYHYWFDDHVVMGDHVELKLVDSEPKISYAFAWINELWPTTTVMYGDALNHALYLSRFFDDPLYLRVSGRPLFYVYMLKDVPRPYLSELFRHLGKLGHKPFLIQLIQNYGNNLHQLPDADAYAEFAPNLPLNRKNEWKDYTTKNMQVGLYLNFDHSPRYPKGQGKKPGRFVPHKHRTPHEFYSMCVKRIARWMMAKPTYKVATIFAWNEWSEQAAMEPSELNDYGMINATFNCKNTILHQYRMS